MSASKRTRLHIAAIGAGTGLAVFAVQAFADSPLKRDTFRSIPGRLLDGSVVAGMSPDTRTAIFVTPKDAPLTYTFDQAQAHCASLDAHGHQDWRVPTRAELSVLFENRAAIGGFDTTGSRPAGWYWSSSQYGIYFAWQQRFSDGHQDDYNKVGASSLRCVRG